MEQSGPSEPPGPPSPQPAAAAPAPAAALGSSMSSVASSMSPPPARSCEEAGSETAPSQPPSLETPPFPPSVALSQDATRPASLRREQEKQPRPSSSPEGQEGAVPYPSAPPPPLQPSAAPSLPLAQPPAPAPAGRENVDLPERSHKERLELIEPIPQIMTGRHLNPSFITRPLFHWIKGVVEGRAQEMNTEAPHLPAESLAAALFPQDQGRILQYEDIARQGQKFWLMLGTWELQPGDRVATLTPGCPEFPPLLYGALAAGCVTAPLDPHLNNVELLSVLLNLRPRLVLCEPQFFAFAVSVIRMMPSATRPRLKPILDRFAWEQMLQVAVECGESDFQPHCPPGHSDEYYVPEWKDDDVMVVCTAGQHGCPRLVVHTDERMQLMIHSLTETLCEPRPGDRWLVTEPIYTMAGVLLVLNWLVTGARLTWMPRRLEPQPADGEPLPTINASQVIEQLIRQYNSLIPVNMLSLTPPLLLEFSHVEGIVEHFPSTYLFLFGDWIPKAVLSRVKRILEPVEVRQAYVAAEVGVALGPLSMPEDPPTCGCPLPSVRAVVVGPEGDILPPGHRGELLIQSLAAADGYLGDVQASKKHFPGGGWWRSGDYAAYNCNGRFFVYGSLSHRITHCGVTMTSQLYEERLLEHEAVLAAAVVAEDEGERERPTGFVVFARNDARPPVHQLCLSTAREYPHLYLSGGLRTVDGVVRDSAGKVLRRHFAADDPAEPEAVEPWDDIGTVELSDYLRQLREYERQGHLAAAGWMALEVETFEGDGATNGANGAANQADGAEAFDFATIEAGADEPQAVVMAPDSTNCSGDDDDDDDHGYSEHDGAGNNAVDVAAMPCTAVHIASPASPAALPGPPAPEDLAANEYDGVENAGVELALILGAAVRIAFPAYSAMLPGPPAPEDLTANEYGGMENSAVEVAAMPGAAVNIASPAYPTLLPGSPVPDDQVAVLGPAEAQEPISTCQHDLELSSNMLVQHPCEEPRPSTSTLLPSEKTSLSMSASLPAEEANILTRLSPEKTSFNIAAPLTPEASPNISAPPFMEQTNTSMSATLPSEDTNLRTSGLLTVEKTSSSVSAPRHMEGALPGTLAQWPTQETNFSILTKLTSQASGHCVSATLPSEDNNLDNSTPLPLEETSPTMSTPQLSEETDPNSSVLLPSKETDPNPSVLLPSKETDPNPSVLLPSKETDPNPSVLLPSKETYSISPVLLPSKETHSISPVLLPSKETHSISPVLLPSKETHSISPVLLPSKETYSISPVLLPSKETHSISPVLLPSKETYSISPVLLPSQETHSISPVLLPSKKTDINSAVMLPSEETSPNLSVPLPLKETDSNSSVPLPLEETDPNSSVPLPLEETDPNSSVLLPSKETDPNPSVLLPSKETDSNPSVLLPSKETDSNPSVLLPSKETDPNPSVLLPSKETHSISPVLLPSKKTDINSAVMLPSEETSPNLSVPLPLKETDSNSSVPLPLEETDPNSSVPLPLEETDPNSSVPLPLEETDPNSSVLLPLEETDPNSSVPLPLEETDPNSSVLLPLEETDPNSSVLLPLEENDPNLSVPLPLEETDPNSSVLLPLEETDPNSSVPLPLEETDPNSSVLLPLEETDPNSSVLLPLEETDPNSSVPLPLEETDPNLSVPLPLEETDPNSSVPLPLEETDPNSSVLLPLEETDPNSSVPLPLEETDPNSSVLLPLEQTDPNSSVLLPLEETDPNSSVPLPLEESDPNSSVPLPLEETDPNLSVPLPLEETDPNSSVLLPLEETDPNSSVPLPLEETDSYSSVPLSLEETDRSLTVPVRSDESNPNSSAQTFQEDTCSNMSAQLPPEVASPNISVTLRHEVPLPSESVGHSTSTVILPEEVCSSTMTSSFNEDHSSPAPLQSHEDSHIISAQHRSVKVSPNELASQASTVVCPSTSASQASEKAGSGASAPQTSEEAGPSVLASQASKNSAHCTQAPWPSQEVGTSMPIWCLPKELQPFSQVKLTFSHYPPQLPGQQFSPPLNLPDSLFSTMQVAGFPVKSPAAIDSNFRFGLMRKASEDSSHPEAPREEHHALSISKELTLLPDGGGSVLPSKCFSTTSPDSMAPASPLKGSATRSPSAATSSCTAVPDSPQERSVTKPPPVSASTPTTVTASLLKVPLKESPSTFTPPISADSTLPLQRCATNSTSAVLLLGTCPQILPSNGNIPSLPFAVVPTPPTQGFGTNSPSVMALSPVVAELASPEERGATALPADQSQTSSTGRFTTLPNSKHQSLPIRGSTHSQTSATQRCVPSHSQTSRILESATLLPSSGAEISPTPSFSTASLSAESRASLNYESTTALPSAESEISPPLVSSIALPSAQNPMTAARGSATALPSAHSQISPTLRSTTQFPDDQGLSLSTHGFVSESSLASDVSHSSPLLTSPSELISAVATSPSLASPLKRPASKSPSPRQTKWLETEGPCVAGMEASPTPGVRRVLIPDPTTPSEGTGSLASSSFSGAATTVGEKEEKAEERSTAVLGEKETVPTEEVKPPKPQAQAPRPMRPPGAPISRPPGAPISRGRGRGYLRVRASGSGFPKPPSACGHGRPPHQ